MPNGQEKKLSRKKSNPRRIWRRYTKADHPNRKNEHGTDVTPFKNSGNTRVALIGQANGVPERWWATATIVGDHDQG